MVMFRLPPNIRFRLQINLANIATQQLHEILGPHK